MNRLPSPVKNTARAIAVATALAVGMTVSAPEPVAAKDAKEQEAKGKKNRDGEEASASEAAAADAPNIVMPVETDPSKLVNDLFDNLQEAFRTGDKNVLNFFVATGPEGQEGKDTELGQSFGALIDAVVEDRENNKSRKVRFIPIVLAADYEDPNSQYILIEVIRKDKGKGWKNKQVTLYVADFDEISYDDGSGPQTLRLFSLLDEVSKDEAAAIEADPALLRTFEPDYEHTT